MSPTSAIEPGAKVLRRRRALEPNLVKLREALQVVPRDAALIELANLAGGTLPLDPWLVSKIAPPVGHIGASPAQADLLLQCLAFLMKSGSDMARLKRETERAGAEFYRLQAELMLASAIGMALLRETQKEVDDLVGLGKVEDARLLTRFQHRLRTAVRERKESIAESNRVDADQLVEHLTDHAGHRGSLPDPGLEPVGSRPASAGRRATESAASAAAQAGRRRREHFRTEVLLGCATVAFVVWLVGHGLPWRAEPSASLLARKDFAAAAPILEVVARPPSVYVDVDEALWERLDDDRKLHLVGDMGSVLLSHGYWGLFVRTPSGRSLASWRDDGGARLVKPAAETPASTDPVPPTRYDRFVP